MGECAALFSDRERYRMHSLWSHKTAVMSVAAKNSEWAVRNHFESEKPLKYACPYAGCLRGADKAEEIEDHILRHHDIADPTKPKEQSQSEKKKRKQRMVKRKEKEMGDVEIAGVPSLCEAEKRRLEVVWVQAKAKAMDRKNRQSLMHNLVASLVDDTVDKFDATTKRLQKDYQANMERLARQQRRNIHGQLVHSHAVRVIAPPPLDEEMMEGGFDDAEQE